MIKYDKTIVIKKIFIIRENIEKNKYRKKYFLLFKNLKKKIKLNNDANTDKE